MTKPTPLTYIVLPGEVGLSEIVLGVGRIDPPRRLRFVERQFPGSNMVVISKDKPALVDAGYRLVGVEEDGRASWTAG